MKEADGRQTGHPRGPLRTSLLGGLLLLYTGIGVGVWIASPDPALPGWFAAFAFGTEVLVAARLLCDAIGRPIRFGRRIFT